MPDLTQLQNRAYRYAVALTGNEVDAEDILQEAWASVIRARGPLEPAYLFRAVRTRWIDAHRRQGRTPWEHGDDEAIVQPEADRLVTADALWQGLLTLSPAQREVLYLHLVEGWTTREVAERTGQPRNTVLSHLSRGRRELQQWLTTHLEVRDERAG